MTRSSLADQSPRARHSPRRTHYFAVWRSDRPGENLEYAVIADHGVGRRSEVQDDEARRREPPPANPMIPKSAGDTRLR